MEPITCSVSGASPACVINCTVYHRDGSKRQIPMDDISDVLSVDDDSYVWIGVNEPEDAVLEKLQEEFGLHELAIEDAQSAHQRPKVEAYGNSLFIVASNARAVDEKITYGETHIFLGPRYLLTVRHGTSPSYTPARTRVEREPERFALGPSYGMYAVLDAIVDNYLPIVDSFKQTLMALEQDIISETFRRRTVARLYDLKRELTYMRVAVAPMQDVLGQLLRSGNGLIPDDVKLYLRDVYDHSLRVNESIDVLRDMIGTAMSVNQSLVNLAQGETMKRLAGWAALLAAPTLITSWYGMNFENMPELHYRYSYFVLIGVLVLVVSGLYRYLRKIRWL